MRVGVVAFLLALLAAAPAHADGWLPHASDATWTYQWTDTAYNPTPTNEVVTVKSTTANNFALAWTTDGAGNPAGALAECGNRLVPADDVRPRQRRLAEHPAA